MFTLNRKNSETLKSPEISSYSYCTIGNYLTHQRFQSHQSPSVSSLYCHTFMAYKNCEMTKNPKKSIKVLYSSYRYHHPCMYYIPAVSLLPPSICGAKMGFWSHGKALPALSPSSLYLILVLESSKAKNPLGDHH